MASEVGPLGQPPLSRLPHIPARAFAPRPSHDEDISRLDAGQRSGTRDGFIVDAGRRVDAFAARAPLTEDQAQKFDAAGEGFLKAVAAIRAERFGSLETAQRTQVALEDFALQLDAVQLPQGGNLGMALTALVGELQQLFDRAFEQPGGREQAQAAQLFFPRVDAPGAPAERLLAAYRADPGGRGLPPSSSIDRVA